LGGYGGAHLLRRRHTGFRRHRPDHWCATAATIEACITERTKAIITVDSLRRNAQHGRHHEVAERHGIPIIEDAAEAIGADWKGHAAGSLVAPAPSVSRFENVTP